jgi:hypothetical protein
MPEGFGGLGIMLWPWILDSSFMEAVSVNCRPFALCAIEAVARARHRLHRWRAPQHIGPLFAGFCVCNRCIGPASASQRFGTALVPSGSLQLKNRSFAADFTPIDKDCCCPTWY